MKSKISRGNGFSGTLNYVLDEGKKRTGNKLSELVAGNMSGENAKALSREFNVSRNIRPEIKSPVWHTSLSLPKGEKLSSARWDQAVNLYLNKMGVDTSKHQFVAARHNDTDYDHVHIVMSRIALDGQVWHGKRDVFLSIEATQAIEKEMNLTITAGYDELTKSGKKRPNYKEVEMANRTNELPTRMALQNIIDEAIVDKVDVFAFIERIESAGVIVIPNIAKTGRLNGFAFEMDGIRFKGSDLGDDYKWGKKPSKLKEMVIYEQVRQSKQLIERAESIKLGCNERDKRKTEEPERNRVTSDRSIENNESRQRSEQGDSIGNQNREPVPHEPSQPVTERKSEPTRDNTAQRQDLSSEPRGVVDRAGRSSNTVEIAKVENKIDLVNGGNIVRSSIVDVVNDYISDNLAPKDMAHSRSYVAKVAAWNKQADALDSPYYRITLKGRKNNTTINLGKNKNKDETFFNREKIDSMIQLLASKNIQGYDIYITPIDKDNHYLVVDDLTNEKYKEFISNGYNPILTQQSSENNIQCILKIKKIENNKEEQSRANKIVVGINRKYGDPNFSGVVHPFRMAGFSNKKPSKNNALTKIINVGKELCKKATILLLQQFNKDEAIKLELEKERQEKDVERKNKAEQANRLNNIKHGINYHDDNNINKMFKSEWNKISRFFESRGELDHSRVDYRVCMNLINKGYEIKDIKEALIDCSPELFDRKHNALDYVERTVNNAYVDCNKKQKQNDIDNSSRMKFK